MSPVGRVGTFISVSYLDVGAATPPSTSWDRVQSSVFVTGLPWGHIDRGAGNCTRIDNVLLLSERKACITLSILFLL